MALPSRRGQGGGQPGGGVVVPRQWDSAHAGPPGESHRRSAARTTTKMSGVLGDFVDVLRDLQGEEKMR
uniref:Uncharacterized protein n=1 Tax=Oryza meridionalis TaxID=40149 RepID=A0A0E0CAZ2_9ORYZ